MMAKRYTSVILALLFMLSVALPCFANASSDFAGGDGTSDNPYLISTKEQLDNVRKKNNDLYFKLANDIVFTDADFEEGGAFYNDGYGFLPIENFGGKFDGNGFSIVNLKQDGKNEKEYGGLFGKTYDYKNVIIKNLNIKDCSIKDFAFAGGIAGSIRIGEINNCTASGEVSGFKSVGGILGAMKTDDMFKNRFNIYDCCNNAKVTLDTSNSSPKEYYHPYVYLGGIIGDNTADVYNCINNGSLNAQITKELGVYIGGISADTYREWGGTASVKRCYNTADVNVEIKGEYISCFVGGIIGEGIVEESYNIGKITVEASKKGFNCGAVSGSFEEETVNNYYLEGTAEVPYGDAGKEEHGDLELTAEEMKNQESFEGFDFVTGWRMGDSNGYSYPVQVNTNEGITALKGKGTQEEPYLVSSSWDLETVRSWYDSIVRSEALYFEMTNDIVFEEADFEEGGAFYNEGNGFAPIGLKNRFNGNFNGNGYSIVNMKQSGRATAAIFIGNNAYISNLGTKDCVFEATCCAAGISIGGTIENCTSNSTVTAEGENGAVAGGIAADAEFNGSYHTVYKVTRCSNKSEIKAISTGETNNAYAGNITAKAQNGDAYAGGIKAAGNKNLVVNCYNVGKITGETDGEAFVGAICTNSKTEKLSVYYLDESASYAASDGEDKGATRCTREEMLKAETYKEFGMGAYWEMGDESYPYPILKKEPNVGILFESGSGTKDDPFTVATKEQLNNVNLVTCSDSSSYCYKLVNDIVFEEADFLEGGAFYNDGCGFLPIGLKTTFNGSFDGNGFKIEGLVQNITKTQFENIGLFGCINGGTVKNLTLNKCTITADNEENTTKAGGIAGFIYGDSLISNCTVSESLVNNIGGFRGSCVGGIVGDADDSVIENCNSFGEVLIKQKSDNTVYAGGIAGRFTNLSEMRNTLNSSTVTLINEDGKYEDEVNAKMGGLCGYTEEAYLINCFSEGTLISEKENKEAGGLVGYAYASLMAINCAYVENGVPKAIAKSSYIMVPPPVRVEPADRIGGFYTDTIRTLQQGEKLTFNEADSNFGDVTGDLKVNSKDIAIVQRMVAGKSNAEGIIKMLADVNADTETNSRDIAQLQKIVTAG